MNKRDREQLRACVAKELVQGKRDHSPTKELLKQYAPLDGIVAPPGGDSSALVVPVEKSLAPHATVALRTHLGWHDANEASPASAAPDASVELYAEVKGELRVPNTVSFSLFPTLDPFAKALYYQLFLLSYGFQRDTCIIGLAKLARSVLMSQRKVQDTILYLERRHLIKRVATVLGGPSKGNIYHVMLPATIAPGATVTSDATMATSATSPSHATVARQSTSASVATKKLDDDESKKQSSSNSQFTVADGPPVENHKGEKAQQSFNNQHFESVQAAYMRITGNNWNQADSESYEQNAIGKIPVEKVVSVMENVARRTAAKINSFRYFVKEILAAPDPRSRAWQKKQLERIARRVRDNAVGRANYSGVDFVEDVKCACAREGVRFDNDLFNQWIG